MLKDSRHRQVGYSMGISPKTVANYLATIRDKLKPAFDLHFLVSKLRVKSQFSFKVIQFPLLRIKLYHDFVSIIQHLSCTLFLKYIMFYLIFKNPISNFENFLLKRINDRFMEKTTNNAF